MNKQVESVLNHLLDEKQIKRILASSKEFVEFKVSVFNIGSVAKIKCTDRPNYNISKDGYSFVLETIDVIDCLEELRINYYKQLK